MRAQALAGPTAVPKHHACAHHTSHVILEHLIIYGSVQGLTRGGVLTPLVGVVERAMAQRAMRQGKAARQDMMCMSCQKKRRMSMCLSMYRRLHACQGACPCAVACVHVKAHVHVPSPQGKPCQTCRDAPVGKTPRVNAARGIPISKPATPLDGVVMLHVVTLHGFV